MTDAHDPSSRTRGWHDDPITSAVQDSLGRAAVAERFAGLIGEGHSTESSLVYGLEGPWGCGKSSVIALITATLGGRSEGWRVVAFTPWATTGTDGLLAEFFAALASAAPDAAKKKQLRVKLSEYMAVARPFVSLIPVAGEVLAAAVDVVQKRPDKPWKKLFDEIAEEIKRLESPILVVVDDIDRLQPSELLDLLKVVRLLGRFPGVDFLLAYDEQTLVELLQGPGLQSLSRARARAFMEKIVQYPLSIPPLLTSQIVRLLNDGLTELFSRRRIEERFDQNRIGSVLLATMPSQLRTPRAIGRFLAQVREELGVHDTDEVDDTDLVLAVFLRVQFPEVFARLQEWKPQLTTSGRSGVDSLWRRSDDAEVDWSDLVCDPGHPRNERDALAVLRAIFPAVEGSGRVKAGSRFANPHYFDRYLAQTIPEGDIPDAVVTRALNEAAAGTATLLRQLLTAEDEQRTILAFGKIGDRYPDVNEVRYHDGPDGPVTRELLAFCMGQLSDMSDSPGRLWSPYLALRSWGCILLRRLLADDPETNVDEELAACTTDDRRVYVVAVSAGKAEGLNEVTLQALRATLQRESERVVPMLVGHLAQGDEAGTTLNVGGLLTLIAGSTSKAILVQAIRQGISAGTFTRQDVAARLVSVTALPGETPSYCGFDASVFTELTGHPAYGVDHVEASDWPDASWARRRQFASNYIGEDAERKAAVKDHF